MTENKNRRGPRPQQPKTPSQSQKSVPHHPAESAEAQAARKRYPKTPYPRTCALLEGAGIDPDVVAEDGMSADGYWAFVLDENGKRKLADSGPDAEFVMVLKPWPYDLAPTKSAFTPDPREGQILQDRFARRVARAMEADQREAAARKGGTLR